MKNLDAIRPILRILALAAVVLALTALLVSLDKASLLIPSPEGTAEQLLVALGAHRYEGAMNTLSQDLQQSVKKEDLRAMMEALEASPLKGIQDAHEQQSEEQGDQATATVQVTFGSNEKQTVSLPLKKENGLWKVNSIDPLRALSQP